MKISQKQANLLAKEIVRQLKAKKVQKVPDHIKSQLESFQRKRKQLIDKKDQVQEEIKTLDLTLVKIIGKGTSISAYHTLSQMIEKLEEKAIPREQEIEDKIILKSMFKSEEDMETFVNSIVKEYEKKLQSKVLQN